MTDKPITSGDTMAAGPRQRSSASGSKHAPLAEFANFQEGYVRHYISLADTKASLLFGLASAFIAYLFSKPVFHALLFNPTCTLPSWLAWASTGLLAAGAGYAAWVIAPRLKTTGEGLVFFGAVRAHADAGAYAEAVRSAGADGLADARLRHCYDVSGVCWRKYQNLRRAICLSVAGLMGALPLLASF
jgi:Family of unknown function (DUF5706)